MPRGALAQPATFLLGLLLALGAGCGGGGGGGGGGSQSTGSPGDHAPDFVQAGRYPSLRLEIDYIAGFRPSDAALAQARAIWEQRLSKPGGIEIDVATEIPASQGQQVWSLDGVGVLEKQYRRNWTGDAANPSTAVMWMVYLDGGSEFDEGMSVALGVAYGSSEAAIFAENINKVTFNVTHDVVEAMVVVHEAGHLFGLVDNGVRMTQGHLDPHSPSHDVSPACVMFHQIPTNDPTLLLGNPPIDYDLPCRLDLFAAGGPPAGGEPGGAGATVFASEGPRPPPHPDLAPILLAPR
jgi:hypothetical protein